ncbi:PRC-barrel domain-containing protein [Bradyrhizobium sp.]|uniref:PRC-barrel domain-containing protein n=1 Tax=Bradyrhizobium sp. TaxID=376 RepID=UPI001DD85551|nr:PRC-barrel domain-containing protein [Bradyrhizobium sp.]MBI5322245.1 PRC-barrel domain-containing protein [Bradyrhizobium sp.]
MIAKYAIAGLAGSALLASVAFAQSPSTPSDTTKNSPTTTMSDTSRQSSFQGSWRASKLVGLSVYNDKNESVGSINDLLTDKNGKITAVVIGVGGFLGVGEHLVAVPFEKVKFSDQPVAYTGASNAPAKPSTTTTGAATAPAASKPNPWWPDHAVFNATKDELKAMPEFKYAT